MTLSTLEVYNLSKVNWKVKSLHLIMNAIASQTWGSLVSREKYI